MAKTVLVVDDDPTQRRLIQAVLEREGFAFEGAESGPQALDRLARGGIDVILLDMVMPGMTGLETLKEARLSGVACPVIVLTATGGIETVVQAMRAGAQDFFVKPASPERILISIRNALQMGDLTAEVSRLKKHQGGRLCFDDLVGSSPAMQLVKRLGQRAAQSNIPVLILGESGVGKEVIARAVHGASARAGKPFVAVNCGALPANLVESILFGHEKGSFTGATDKHLGKFKEADGGTLFLDEVGELPPDMQVKLLRALQEGEIDPVGSKRPVKVDVRILSATNRDLGQQVDSGAFREDLYYRLNVFPIYVPPLRDRTEDIAVLAMHFMTRLAAEAGKRITGISEAALALLKGYNWPGNVRQLENAIYRAIVLSDGGYLELADFPQIVAQTRGRDETLKLTETLPAPSAPVHIDAVRSRRESEARDTVPDRFLDARGEVAPLPDLERELIAFALKHYGGRMSKVARALKIGRSTLYRKLRDYGLEDGVESDAA